MAKRINKKARIELILNMRANRKNFKEIAEVAGVSADTIKTFVKQNKVDTSITGKCICCGKEYKTYSVNTYTCSKKCSDKEYDKRRAGTKRFHQAECKWCGKTYRTKNNSRYCSDKCREIKFEEDRIRREKEKIVEPVIKKCEKCSRSFVARSKTHRYCSSGCRAKEKEIYHKECKECGVHIVTTSKVKKYCSKKCANRYSWRLRETNRRSKLQANGPIDYTITLAKLYERDHGICHICMKKTDYQDYKEVDGVFIAGKNYPSIDHVIPVAKGGVHQWDNVKLAHMVCNSKKNDKVM